MSIFTEIFGDTGFDSSTVEPQKDFELLPPGKYTGTIVEVEVKQTKKGDGHYLKVEFQITDGPALNRKLWANINIDNPSPVAQQIGLSQLSGLCKACGVPQCRDEQELKGKSCIASVKVKKDKSTGQDNNEIKAWLPHTVGVVAPTDFTDYTPPPKNSGVVQPEAVTTTGTKPPWQR